MDYTIPTMPEIDEIQEQKLPCIIMVDTSGSLSGYESQIVEGLQALKDAIIEDDMARARIDLCVIEFNNHASVIQNFTLASDFTVPNIRCHGSTATHEAVKLALEMGNARKAQYRAERAAYKQPWYWLFTDGASTDADNGSFAELMDVQMKRKGIFFGVAVGNERSLPALGAMNKSGLYLKISKEGFREAFEYISQSVSEAAEPDFDNQMKAPDPDSGIQVFRVRDNMITL